MPGRPGRPLFRGAGGVGMGADDGAVNDEVFGIQVIGQALVERGPDAAVVPVGITSVDGVPFAVFRRRHSPRRAGAGNPKYGGNETAAIGFTAAVEVGAAAEEGEDFVPLVGRMSVPSLPCRNDNTKMSTRPRAHRTFLTHSYTVPGLTARTRLMAVMAVPSPYLSMACSLTCFG